MSNGGEKISVKLIVVLGSAIVAAFTLAQLAVNQLSQSSDRDSEHYHELVTAIIQQMDRQHSDFLAESKANREVVLDLSNRIAARFPVISRKKHTKLAPEGSTQALEPSKEETP
jgi:hypothetical protein